jgi:hypothetical protein
MCSIIVAYAFPHSLLRDSNNQILSFEAGKNIFGICEYFGYASALEENIIPQQQNAYSF